MAEKKIGAVTWMDLTVADATKVSDFYSKVVGWTIQGFDMKGYEDYCMNDTQSGETQAGICHARGTNAGLPPTWLPYITVDDIDKSLEEVIANGGKVAGEKRNNGQGGFYCLVQDPAGAYVMLNG